MKNKVIKAELTTTPIEMYGVKGFILKIEIEGGRNYEAWSEHLDTFLNESVLEELEKIIKK